MVLKSSVLRHHKIGYSLMLVLGGFIAVVEHLYPSLEYILFSILILSMLVLTVLDLRTEYDIFPKDEQIREIIREII